MTATATPSASATTKPPVPVAPTNVRVAAGNSSIKVSWTASADNGTKITGYVASASPGPATCTTTGTTSCVLGGAAGTLYAVSVVALSAGGSSAESEPSAAVVPTTVPVSATPPDTDLPLDTADGAISSAEPGQELVVLGSGYASYSSVTITVYSEPNVLATAIADAGGAFKQSVPVPANLSSGTHSFVAAGVDPSGNFRAQRLDVTVGSSGDNNNGGGGGLPVTGTAVIWLIVSGFALTLAGVAVRAIWR
ncbi:MAG TPA: fibronectin type III domain-containing protein [Actinoplanes sp.]